MAMRKIMVDQLRPGMKFTKSLFDNHLNIVLPAGKELDQFAIKNLSVRYVDVVETAGKLLEEETTNEKPKPEKKTILVDNGTAKYLEL